MGNMKVLNLIQGSPEWIEERILNRTASEAAAMMGDSKYMTRDQLLKLKKGWISGATPWFQQKLFDDGHGTEAKARPIVERLINEILFPITAKALIDGIDMLASVDGITEMYDILFEHKMWNEELAANVRNKILESAYYWQLEQQMMVTGAKKVIFVVSDGTEKKMEHMWYESVPERRAQLIAGWKQFDKDLETYEIKAVVEKTVAQSIETLPALAISISGEVSASNLQAYEDAAMSLISNINTDLQSDQDFTDAKAMVKFCDDAEKELKAAKERALSQTEDISALFTTLDKLGASIREKRLNLNRQVTDQTASKKKALIDAAFVEVEQYLSKVNETLDDVDIPHLYPDYEGAIKRKSNFDLMEGSLNDLVASSKILINETADRFRANLKLMNDAGAANLFQDIRSVVDTSPDHFTLLVESRVNAEKQRLEAEKKRILDEEAERVRKVEADRVAKEKRQEEAAEADRLLEIARERRESEAKAELLNNPEPNKVEVIKDVEPAEVVSIAPAEKKELQFKVVDLNGLPERFVNIDIIGIRAELEAGNSVTGVEVIG